MKRKFAFIGFSFFLGLVAFSVEWGEYFYTVTILGFVWVVSAFLCLKKYRIYVLTCGIAFFTGISYSQLYTHFNYDKVISYDNKLVTIKGYILDYEYLGSDNGSLTVKGNINNGETAEISFYVPHNTYRYYDEIEIKGTVKAIKNTVDFQAKEFYRPKGIYLKGTQVSEINLLNKNYHPILKAIKEYRDYMFSLINNVVGGQEGAAISAMICGDKSELDASTKDLIYRVGIGHIFAVSGTHLVMIAALLGFLLNLLPINKRICSIILIVIVWAFAVFAGFSPSVVRASIMLTLVISSQMLNRTSDCLNTLGICCVLLTIGNPYTVRDPSFLLSMTGTLGIGVVAPQVIKKIKYKGVFLKPLKTFIALTSMLLVILPVSLLFFDQISIVAPLTNLFLLPLCTFSISITVLVLVTGGVSFIAIPVLKTAGILMKIVLYISDKIASWEYSAVTITQFNLEIVFLVISILGLIAMILLKNTKSRIILVGAVYIMFVGIYNVNRLQYLNELHMIFVFDNKMCQTIMYKDSKGVILDGYAKGKHNNALKRICDKKDISEIKSVLLLNEIYHSSLNYKYDMYPVPDKIIGDFLDLECGGNSFYSNSNDCDFEGFRISRDDKKFSLTNNDFDIKIDIDNFVVNGRKYEFSPGDYVYDLVCFDNDYEVRRLDYGFDEQ